MTKKKEPTMIDIDIERRMKAFLDRPDGVKKFMEYQAFIGQYNVQLYGTLCPPFDTMSIKEKVVHGWMRAIAFTSETIINGRWDYWFDIVSTQQVEGKDIPQLKFHSPGSPQFQEVSKMISDCLNYIGHKGVFGYTALSCFVDWVLFGFGSKMCTELPREITDDVNEYWYKNFKIEKMYIYPADYIVSVAAEIYGSKKFNATAFYPTPSCIVDMMVRMTYNEADKEKNKYAGVIEPCMGSGIMLLYQSNYSLRLHGQDIDILMCKIATMNGYLYVPWMVECDKNTSKLLADMHDKYFNGEMDFSDEFISFLNTPMYKKADEQLINSLN